MHAQKLVAVLLAGACLAGVPSVGTAQDKPRLNHTISPHRDSRPLHNGSARSSVLSVRDIPDTVRLLAVMVEFQLDDDPLTTGSGRFDTSTTAGFIIDPPPRNLAYFENHLLFLQNYWRRVTKGKLIVQGEVVDTVIQLPHPMRYYSPPSGSAVNRELGLLVEDAWKQVDAARPLLDFSRYDAFCVFHAGVGRDIDMTALLGYDPTPFDIPSLYLNLASMRTMFGPQYRGVAVRDSSFFITNSMILPETESRTIPTIGGQFLLQLGLNGLVAASFGSYLGLPDLFDTNTGSSGIGRFGLMDGQSIFSWNGVIPPEPSAWEKYFLDQTYGLGLLEVVEAPPGESSAILPAVSLRDSGKDTVYKLAISAKEYFLLENRNRDARRDSAIVWMWYNGQVIRKAFWRDTVGFNAFDQGSLYGVIIDVDEFDWSLPGGVSTAGEFFDGGILIWHIDENVIDAHYSTNTINADPRRRGVNLKEADGSQDIGHSYGFLHPGGGSESGTALDFWYSGNPAPVYRNEFSSTSHPNSFSNDGANSHIAVRGFSQRGPQMTATVQVGDDVVEPLAGFPRFVGMSHSDNSPQFFRAIFVSKGDSVLAFRPRTGESATPEPNGLFSERGGQFPVAFIPWPADSVLIVGVQDSSLLIWGAVDLDGDGIFESISQRELPFSARLTTAPVVLRGAVTSYRICIGDVSGKVNFTSIDGAWRDSIQIGTSPVSSIALYRDPTRVDASDSVVAVAGNILRVHNGNSVVLPNTSPHWEVATVGTKFAVADRGGNSFLLFDRSLQRIHHSSFGNPQTGLTSLAVGDIDGDGRRDIVFGVGKKLYAVNEIGSTLDNFPVTASAPVAGAPVIAKLSSDAKEAHIIVAAANGLVAAYTNKGKMLAGFPLALAAASLSTPLVFALTDSAVELSMPALVVHDNSGYLSGWRLSDLSVPLVAPWGSYRGNIFHSGADETTPVVSPPPSEFFPTSRAYNWPNPVYDGKTKIRYFISEDAQVRIKIFDLAGEIVETLTGRGVGGLDNEVEWDVGRIQSGIYFGHIEAEGSGKRGVAVIKIAVVK